METQHERNDVKCSEATWGGIVALVRSLVSTGAFGFRYPELCPDGAGPIGTNNVNFGLALHANIPTLEWPLSEYPVPPAEAIVRLLEFCHYHVAEPNWMSHHPYFDHWHLGFDVDSGQFDFRESINRILLQGGLNWTLNNSGQVISIVEEEIRNAIFDVQIRTGDAVLDDLLHESRDRYASPDHREKRIAVEKLWDAWERLKTIEPGKDKNESMTALLTHAAPNSDFRELLSTESQTLTGIGNKFHIRHSEISQVEIKDAHHLNYLFHRMFSMITLLLKSTGRAR